HSMRLAQGFVALDAARVGGHHLVDSHRACGPRLGHPSHRHLRPLAPQESFQGSCRSSLRRPAPGTRRARAGDSIYFASITGLTIGYGDFAPQSPVSRVLAVFIGLCGLLITGGVAAVAVKAFPEAEAPPGAEANPKIIPHRRSKIQP